jgi:hypothetical protein
MITRTFIAALAMGILATAGLAHADTSDTVTGTLLGGTGVNSAGDGVNPGLYGMSVSFPGGTSPYSPGWVGQINWDSASFTQGSTPSGLTTSELGTSFATYCIEGTQDVNFGSAYTWDVTKLLPGQIATGVPNPGTGGLSGTQVSQLYALWDTHYLTDASTPTGAAAFQLSVWEIVSGDTLAADPTPFTSGLLTASTGGPSDPSEAAEQTALNTASDWVQEAINGTGNFTALYTLYGLTNGSAQDQIIAIPGSAGGTPPGPVTPIPAALPAGLSVMGCIGAAQLLRRRRQTVAA